MVDCGSRGRGVREAGLAPSRRRGRWYAVGLAGLAGLAGVAGFSGAASATGNSDGRALVVACSADQLIAAIVRANATGGAQLTLAQHCTYTLTTPQGADGLPVITQPITIDGRGATITRAASATNFRILNTGVGGNLTLTNLTITGGIANGQGGGALLVQAGGQATLRDTTITGNQSTSRGGGIANYGITAILGDNHSASRVNGNTSQTSGGGVYNEGHLTTDHATVNGNTSNGEGGGLTDRGTATLADTRIDHNQSGSDGGGLATVAAVTKLTGSSVSDNTTDGPGGGIVCLASTVYVQRTTVDRNTAGGDLGGGGIYNQSVPFPSGGPAIAVIDDSEVNGNTATGSDGGGGIANRSADLAVRRSQVSYNRATGTGSQGGGILNSLGTVSLTAVRVVGNSAAAAPGGIFNNNEATVDQASVIIGNRPTNCAGSPSTVPNCFG